MTPSGVAPGTVRQMYKETTMITLTDKAATKVAQLIKDEGADNLALRVAVKAGG